MRVITGILLASLACALLVAAGCTASSHTPAVSTTPAVPAVVSAPADSAGADPWSGIWDIRASTPVAIQTGGVLTLIREGSSVTGTYSNGDQGKGALSGTVSGNQLAGTWKTEYGYETDTGSFVFVLSDDRKSFSGTWVDASDRVNSISTSKEYWDGAKRSS